MSDIFEKAAQADIAEEPDNEVVEGTVIRYCADSIVLKFEDQDDVTLSCDYDEKHYGRHHDSIGVDEYYWHDTIVLEGNLHDDEGAKGHCTCDWEFGPSDNLLEIGKNVMAHAKETGHIPRQHGSE